MCKQLIELCISNEEYFNADTTELGVILATSFKKIAKFLNKSESVLREIESFAGEYDYDEKIPGNGYRSFCVVFTDAVQYTEKVCTSITEKRRNLFFRKSFYAK